MKALKVAAPVAVALAGQVSAAEVNWTEISNIISGSAEVFGGVLTLVISLVPLLIIIAVVGFIVGIFDGILDGIRGKFRTI